MKTMTIDGVEYAEAPETDSCVGCEFREKGAYTCERVEPHAKIAFGRECIAGSVIYVRVVNVDSPDDLKAAEDARLLDAARDMLEALRGLDDAYCRAGTPLSRAQRAEDRMRLIAARAAIAKAEGKQ